MNLHIEVTGHGEPLVMLHGWGMHGGAWGEVVSALAQCFQVHCVDLPGHGYSGKGERERGITGSLGFTLDSVVVELSARFDVPLNLLGWSLGGMVAQHWAALEPRKIKRLVLVASTPCFAQHGDWDCGVPQETLKHFAADLEKNFATTLRRFLALQVRGSENERELLAGLRERLFSRGEPELAALRGGLTILRDADLRGILPRIAQPALAIAGQRDKLTPPQASHYLAQAMPNARAVEIQGAAHAPFLSHPQVFIEHLKSFLHG
jgi:pimeloyl-[acyl-carrier protein] methyl ester esterase